jgi:EAL domain-containing protein (putative c-di-GMP-specific phosphodiesterase class I)
MLGYDNMNEVLRTLADGLSRLNMEKRLHAELYYLGDGKFRMVFERKHFHQIEKAAKMINKAMKENIKTEQYEVNLVTLVCIARYPEDIDNVEALLAFGNDLNGKKYTGEVLYACDVYHKEHYDLMKDLDGIIESALAEHKFMVYYQPIYSVKEKRFNSAEALVRLYDDKYGFISPEIFIRAAERSGAIHKIGAFVLEEVCRFIASEEFQGLGLEYIEVNLSVVQCIQSGLAGEVMDTLRRYDVSPDKINLEITETAISYSQNILMENLDALTQAGIKFSLDDFGTGYSNVRRIASLPFHLIKLDKTFTDAEHNPKLLIVLKNTIRMIKDMNMEIVVEGIENRKLVEQFAALECEYIQGYYYSKPIPRDEFVTFVRNAME